MNKPYDYKLSSVFGGYMPYVVYMPHDTFKKYPFHIRVKDFNCLSPDGCGCASLFPFSPLPFRSGDSGKPPSGTAELGKTG